MYTLFGDSRSGNCYKVRLLLASTGTPYQWQEVDAAGRTGTRNPAFLAMNPNGKVPVLEIAPGQHLSESNAILWYLADGSPLWPSDRLGRACALQWMFFEQHSHVRFIARARRIVRLLPPEHPEQAEPPGLREEGYRALGVMEHRLAESAFFAGGRYSIADIALFAYTHLGPEAGFDLAKFPAINDWMARVRAQPGFVAMGG